jgi:CDP-2,3-bis-(O-geranylgeranyl)-sn-glycerol synthase
MTLSFSWTIVSSLLLLVLLGNAAPVLARILLGEHLARPLDGGLRLADGRALLGVSKTYRGIAAALLLTAPAAELLGVGWRLGLIIAGAAMAGDLLSSFVKRRLDKPVHARSPLLDEIPEVLLPVLAVALPLALSWSEGLAVVLGFVLAHALLDRLARGIRRRPR